MKPYPIEEKIIKVLTFLARSPTPEADGDTIRKSTGLAPEDINYAIEYWESLGAVVVHRYLGTVPYKFGNVSITARGKYLYSQLEKISVPPISVSVERLGRPSLVKKKPKKGYFKRVYREVALPKMMLPERPIIPVGSPYGFTEQDWGFVDQRNKDRTTLYVVFGMQFESKYYKTDQLLGNIKGHFQRVVDLCNEKLPKKVSLDFKRLEAGYGEHLFNRIARMIIGSDIVVFDVSDQNPNVMIELGVASTWGTSILPLKEKSSPEPPSDISGLTWIEYENSGEHILDKEFSTKLGEMIERAIAKKGATIPKNLATYFPLKLERKTNALVEAIYAPLLGQLNEIVDKLTDGIEMPDLAGFEKIRKDGMYVAIDGEARNKANEAYLNLESYQDAYKASTGRISKIIREEVEKLLPKLEDAEKYRGGGYEVTYRAFIDHQYMGSVDLRHCLRIGKTPVQILTENKPKLEDSDIDCLLAGYELNRRLADPMVEIALKRADEDSVIQEDRLQRQSLLGNLQELIEMLKKQVV